MKNVVKSDGRIEEFDIEKLENSIKKSFYMIKAPEGQAEELTQYVLRQFNSWHKNKAEITTVDIRVKIGKILKPISPETAYIFKNLKGII